MINTIKKSEENISNDKLFNNKIDDRKKWLTCKEAADYLRTKPKQIRNWVYQGKLRAHKLLGRKLLFQLIDLDSLIVCQGGH